MLARPVGFFLWVNAIHVATHSAIPPRRKLLPLDWISKFALNLFALTL
jgi:hypothetical protein